MLRSAILHNVNNQSGIADLHWGDVFSSERKSVSLLQPYVGRGWGIRVGVEDYTSVLVEDSTTEIMAYQQQPAFLNENAEDLLAVAIDEYAYRRLEQGEICLQSKSNSIVHLTNAGDIVLETVEGNSIVINKEDDAIHQTSTQRYINCEAGYTVAGIIKRDIRSQKERENDALFGLSAEFGLTQDYLMNTIGVNPECGKSVIGLFDPTSGKGGSRNNMSDMTNPALVEWNMSINEFDQSEKIIFSDHFQNIDEFLLLGLDCYIINNPFTMSNICEISDSVNLIKNRIYMENPSIIMNSLIKIYKDMLLHRK